MNTTTKNRLDAARDPQLVLQLHVTHKLRGGVRDNNNRAKSNRGKVPPYACSNCSLRVFFPAPVSCVEDFTCGAFGAQAPDQRGAHHRTILHEVEESTAHVLRNREMFA